jgi:hypothetical protein
VLVVRTAQLGQPMVVGGREAEFNGLRFRWQRVRKFSGPDPNCSAIEKETLTDSPSPFQGEGKGWGSSASGQRF